MNWFMIAIAALYLFAALYEALRKSDLWVVYVCWAISNLVLAAKQ